MKHLKYCHDSSRSIGMNEAFPEGLPMCRSCAETRRRGENRT